MTLVSGSIPLVGVKDGDPGKDGIAYYWQCDVKSIAADETGKPLQEVTVTAHLMAKQGTAAAVPVGNGYCYCCLWRIIDGQKKNYSGAAAPISSGSWAGIEWPFSTQYAADSYLLEAYSDSTRTTMLCEPLSIDVVKRGTTGDDAVAYSIQLDERTFARVNAGGTLTYQLSGTVHKTVGSAMTTLTPGECSLTFESPVDGTWENVTEFDLDGSFFDDSYSSMPYASAVNKAVIALRLTVGGVVVARESVPIVLAGATGAAGRMYYYDGMYTSREYTRNSHMTPYVSLADFSMYVLIADTNQRSNGTFIPPTGATDSASAWEIINRGVRFLMTEAMFTAFAKLGSGIFSGDWLMSQYGVIGNNASTDYEQFNDADPMGKSEKQLLSGSFPNLTSSYYESTKTFPLQLAAGQEVTITATGRRSTSTAYLVLTDSTGATVASISYTSTTATTKKTTITVATKGTYTLRLRHGTSSSHGGTAYLTAFVINATSFVPNLAIDLLMGTAYMRKLISSGFNLKLKTVITNEMLDDYITGPDADGWFDLDIMKAGSYVVFKDCTDEINIKLPHIEEEGTYTEAELELARSMVGNILIVRNDGSRRIGFEGSFATNAISSNTYVFIDDGNFAYLECRAASDPNLIREVIRWEGRSYIANDYNR